MTLQTDVVLMEHPKTSIDSCCSPLTINQGSSIPKLSITTNGEKGVKLKHRKSPLPETWDPVSMGDLSSSHLSSKSTSSSYSSSPSETTVETSNSSSSLQISFDAFFSTSPNSQTNNKSQQEDLHNSATNEDKSPKNDSPTTPHSSQSSSNPLTSPRFTPFLPFYFQKPFKVGSKLKKAAAALMLPMNHSIGGSGSGRSNKLAEHVSKFELLDVVLRDDVLFAEFEAFSRKEFCHENLQAWKAVQMMRDCNEKFQEMFSELYHNEGTCDDTGNSTPGVTTTTTTTATGNAGNCIGDRSSNCSAGCENGANEGEQIKGIQRNEMALLNRYKLNILNECEKIIEKFFDDKNPIVNSSTSMRESIYHAYGVLVSLDISMSVNDKHDGKSILEFLLKCNNFFDSIEDCLRENLIDIFLRFSSKQEFSGLVKKRKKSLDHER